jgi:colanic acid/amylovoran biosynthesis glycosyltransferase
LLQQRNRVWGNWVPHRGRVAFVVHAYPIISEVFILYAAIGLVKAGWSVDLIPLDVHDEAAPQRHPVQAEMERMVRVISPHPSSEGARGALGALYQRHGLTALRTIDPMRFARKTFTLRPIYLAEALSRGGPYDIIHCQFGSLAPSMINLRRAGLLPAPILVHFRGNDISTYIARNGRFAYDLTFSEADWFVANCRHFRDRAIDLGCDPARIDVVPSGCDVSRFPFVERRPPEEGPVRLLTVGRLVEKKGHGLAIEATRLLRQRGRDVRLRIVGDGPLRGPLVAQAAEAGLGDVVEFAGAKVHHEIAAELAAAHIFLAPSVRANDGDEDAPVNTLKEAMATGTPVVASCHGGIPELVRHRVNGRLCAENDAADLADEIAAMIGDGDRWLEFGRAGRRAVERHYSLDVATDKLLGAYDSLLSSIEPPLQRRHA